MVYGGILPHSGHGSFIEGVTAPQYRQCCSSSLKFNATSPLDKPSTLADTKADPFCVEAVMKVLASDAPFGIVTVGCASFPCVA